MNSIELPGLISQVTFLKYLNEFCKAHTNDLKNFFIFIDSDNTSCIYPSYGDFHWHDDESNTEFLISYHEEGKPLSSHINDISYFKRLKISHPDISILQKFVTKALTYEKHLDDQKIRVYNSTSKGYFELYGTIYCQTYQSIYLPNEIKKMINTHIDTFLNSKERYVKFGRAYKTSFLLSGVPGSGKSSLAKAIALKYKRPIYMLNFSINMTDETFISMMSDLKDDSILLIEDIDSFFVERQPININISFSALINFMDGVLGKSNGLITFITANNPDRLDPALIRPGRVDIILKFNYPKKQEINTAFLEMTSGNQEDFEEFYSHIKNIKISMSGIIDYLFRNETTFIKNISGLLEQTQILQEIVNDKTDKIYN
jgi:hypothetical protein